MKNDVKKKSDLRATGNKPIHLKDLERGLLDLMEKESNSIFNKIPGAMDVSFGIEDNKLSECVDLDIPNPKKRKLGDEIEDIKSVKKNNKFDEETEETKYLSNQELQRLVLLRHLKVLNLDISKRKERKKEQQKWEKERQEKDKGVIKEFEFEILDEGVV